MHLRLVLAHQLVQEVVGNVRSLRCARDLRWIRLEDVDRGHGFYSTIAYQEARKPGARPRCAERQPRSPDQPEPGGARPYFQPLGDALDHEVPRARSCVQKRRDGASRDISVRETMNPQTALDSDVRACVRAKVKGEDISAEIVGTPRLPGVPCLLGRANNFRAGASTHSARAHDTRWNQTRKNLGIEISHHIRTMSPPSAVQGGVRG